MKKYYFLPFFCFILNYTTLFANHLVGGELTYECLGNNKYKIKLVVYRDCNCFFCADLDDPANITVFKYNGNVQTNTTLPLVDDDYIEPNTDGLCLSTIPDVCLERGYYEKTITLPAAINGYDIAYQRCCRNATIVNIDNPDEQGSTYTSHIVGTSGDCNNSSAFFNNFPPPIICANSPLFFDHSASDPDGDSIVYSLCAPLLGASTNDPQPNTADPPPYDPVDWKNPYNAQNPMGGNPPLEIDPNTGLLTGTPITIGQFVVGICASEYRNGVLINVITRDFQFNVANCVVVTAHADTSFRDTIFACSGQDVPLIGVSYSATQIEWLPNIGLNNPFVINPTALNVTDTLTYILHASNNNLGCTAYDTLVIIPVNVNPIFAGNDVTICPNEQVQLQASGATFYAWTPNTNINIDTIANPIVSPLQTTTYTVSSQASCGVISDDVVVTVNAITATAEISTCGQYATIKIMAANGTSPYQYALNNNAPQYDSVFTNILVGNYLLKITDALGCSFLLPITVAPNIININAQATSLNCFEDTDASISISASGGSPPYLYALNDTITYNVNNTFNNLSANTYTIFVKDNNACTEQKIITITQPTQLNTQIASHFDVSCNAANDGKVTITANGGTAPYSFTLNANTTNNTGIFDNLIPNSYTVVVTDFNSCTSAQSFNISEPSALTSLININQAVCSNTLSTVQITPQGGTPPYKILWSNGTTDSSTVHLLSGNYSVIISDANNCTIEKNIELASIIPIEVSLHAPPINCFNNQVPLSVSIQNATEPIYYQWLNTVLNEDTILVTAGNYTLTISDANNCTSSKSINILQPEELKLNMQFNPILCFNNTTSLKANVLGGTLPYSYAWSNTNQNTNINSNVVSGNYTITVTDANSCTTTNFIQITQPNQLVGTLVTSNKICPNDTASAQISIEGGTLPYNIQWSSGEKNTESISGIQTGNYTVQVSDANNCSISNSFSIQNNAPPPVNIITPDTIMAAGTSITIQTQNVKNATWQPLIGLSCNNCSNPVVLATETTTYTLFNLSENGCPSSDEITIEVLYKVAVPNAFSPNNDGVNDNFKLIAPNVTSYKCVVYNRWGQQVFNTNNYNQPWDGTYKNMPCEVGVYAYFIDFTYLQGTKPIQQFLKGNITIIR